MTMTTREVLETAAAYIKEAIDQLPADSPEVPDRVYQWPYEDEHLRRDFWKKPNGNVWRWVPSESMWQVWSHEYREWAGKTPSLAWMNCTFTRTTDPSMSRTWDTLEDVDTDVERATGDYAGMRRELARSPLSESGWFQRIQDEFPRKWVELPETETNNVTNIREEQ